MKTILSFAILANIYDEFLETKTSFAKNCRSQGVDGELS
jgi:hypothetical protein